MGGYEACSTPGKKGEPQTGTLDTIPTLSRQKSRGRSAGVGRGLGVVSAGTLSFVLGESETLLRRHGKRTGSNRTFEKTQRPLCSTRPLSVKVPTPITSTAPSGPVLGLCRQRFRLQLRPLPLPVPSSSTGVSGGVEVCVVGRGVRRPPFS